MPGAKTNEREGTRAMLRNERLSAYKVRPVLDLIRGQEVGLARDTLALCERDAAHLVGKLLTSAIANAENNDGLDPEELYVSACFADEGPTAKRWRPRARGRATRIRKRTTHITLIVSRLPEDRLNRLRARQAAEAGTRRARRAEGGRQGRRTRRDQQMPGTAPAPETASATPAEPEAPEVEEMPAVNEASTDEVVADTDEHAAADTVDDEAADEVQAEPASGAADDDTKDS